MLYSLQLNNTIYRVPRYPLEQVSKAFASMFETARANTAEGTSDDHPIVLHDVPVEEFETMLLLLYPCYW
jgi:hypothetical protein